MDTASKTLRSLPDVHTMAALIFEENGLWLRFAIRDDQADFETLKAIFGTTITGALTMVDMKPEAPIPMVALKEGPHALEVVVRLPEKCPPRAVQVLMRATGAAWGCYGFATHEYEAAEFDEATMNWKKRDG